MAFRNLTNSGKEYLATRLANELPVKFTKAKIGNGSVPLLTNPANTTDLYNFKKQVTILDAVQEQNSIKLTLQITNDDINEGFYLKEIGIYVDDNGKEVLYWYCNEDNSQYINAQSDTPIVFEIDIMMEVTNINSTIVEWTGKDTWISKSYFDEKVRTYEIPTISELQARKNLKAGDIVEVLGYYEAGDGANHKRIIANEDDGSGVQLANGLWANIVHNGEVNVSWFGAKGDGVNDDTEAIQKALDFNKDIKFANNKTYLIKKTLKITKPKHFDGSFSTIKCDSTFTENIIEISSTNKLIMENLKIVGNNINKNGICFVKNVIFCLFKNITVRENGQSGLIAGSSNFANTFESCHFEWNKLHGVNGYGVEMYGGLTTSTFLDCWFEVNTECGVYGNGVSVNFIGGCIEGNNIGAKFETTDLTYAGSISFDNVDIEGNKKNSLYFDSSKGIKFGWFFISGGQLDSGKNSIENIYVDAKPYETLTLNIETKVTQEIGQYSLNSKNILILTGNISKTFLKNAKNINGYSKEYEILKDSSIIEDYIISDEIIYDNANNSIKYKMKPNGKIDILFPYPHQMSNIKIKTQDILTKSDISCVCRNRISCLNPLDSGKITPIEFNAEEMDIVFNAIETNRAGIIFQSIGIWVTKITLINTSQKDIVIDGILYNGYY